MFSSSATKMEALGCANMQHRKVHTAERHMWPQSSVVGDCVCLCLSWSSPRGQWKVVWQDERFFLKPLLRVIGHKQVQTFVSLLVALRTYYVSPHLGCKLDWDFTTVYWRSNGSDGVSARARSGLLTAPVTLLCNAHGEQQTKEEEITMQIETGPWPSHFIKMARKY